MKDETPNKAADRLSGQFEKSVLPDHSQALDHAMRKANEHSLGIDVEKYQAYLDDPSLSDAQRAEIMNALWSIMMAFVELGFGVHPVQQACGQVEKNLDLASSHDSNVLPSDDTGLASEFNDSPERD
ncbi:hypothetical protein LA6_003677 [Marinibacterium anthonyi]|nr:hypothetical protein LA6_003677 [Marinibacterium anthonyi]